MECKSKSTVICGCHGFPLWVLTQSPRKIPVYISSLANFCNQSVMEWKVTMHVQMFAFSTCMPTLCCVPQTAPGACQDEIINCGFLFNVLVAPYQFIHQVTARSKQAERSTCFQIRPSQWLYIRMPSMRPCNMLTTPISGFTVIKVGCVKRQDLNWCASVETPFFTTEQLSLHSVSWK